jgi:hypothetical protein
VYRNERGINVHLRSARGIPSIVMRRGRPGIAPRQHLIERAAAVSFCPNNLATPGNEDPMQGGAAEARPPNDVTAAICGNVTLKPCRPHDAVLHELRRVGRADDGRLYLGIRR